MPKAECVRNRDRSVGLGTQRGAGGHREGMESTEKGWRAWRGAKASGGDAGGSGAGRGSASGGRRFRHPLPFPRPPERAARGRPEPFKGSSSGSEGTRPRRSAPRAAPGAAGSARRGAGPVPPARPR